MGREKKGMGQRANLVIVRSGGGYDLFYNHWCANTLPLYLFWGPDYAEAFIRTQAQVDESGWLDDIWAEGGAVMDAGRRVLLFYGGEDILYDIPLRKCYLSLLHKVWAGWEIRWAHGGIADLAAYVDHPVEKVIAAKEDSLCDSSLAPPLDSDWTDTIGSVRFEDGELLLYPLSGEAEGYLMNGSPMVKNIRRSYGRSDLNIEDETPNFPTGGFHIDVIERTVELWHASPHSDLASKLEARWEGWSLTDCCDDYERQAESCDGKLALPVQSWETYIQALSKMLLREYADPLRSLSGMIERLSQSGKEVEVSPWAFAHANSEIPLDVRRDILSRAIRERAEEMGLSCLDLELP